MKIIFLDIDGVLNSGRIAKATGHSPRQLSFEDRPYFDWDAVALVRRLCVENVVCVVSSTWRANYTAQELADYFDLPIVDITPMSTGVIKSASGFELVLGKTRGDEIKEWLDSHETQSYIIIDDHNDMLLEQHPRLVHVNHFDGFQFKDYQRALHLLN